MAHPPTNSARPQAPVGEDQQDRSGEDDGDAHGVERFVPRRGVLVIVPRHVLIECRHAEPPETKGLGSGGRRNVLRLEQAG